MGFNKDNGGAKESFPEIFKISFWLEFLGFYLLIYHYPAKGNTVVIPKVAGLTGSTALAGLTALTGCSSVATPGSDSSQAHAVRCIKATTGNRGDTATKRRQVLTALTAFEMKDFMAMSPVSILY
jgi:hypothetical protein